jgi:hypothetical protein
LATGYGGERVVTDPTRAMLTMAAVPQGLLMRATSWLTSPRKLSMRCCSHKGRCDNTSPCRTWRRDGQVRTTVDTTANPDSAYSPVSHRPSLSPLRWILVGTVCLSFAKVRQHIPVILPSGRSSGSTGASISSGGASTGIERKNVVRGCMGSLNPEDRSLGSMRHPFAETILSR